MQDCDEKFLSDRPAMAQALQNGELRKFVAKALQQWIRSPSIDVGRRSLHKNVKRPSIVNKRSTDILHDPWFNKVSYLLPSYFVARVISIRYELVLSDDPYFHRQIRCRLLV